jgi:hypothetical protein
MRTQVRAMAHEILTAAHHRPLDQGNYLDFGDNSLDQLDT